MKKLSNRGLGHGKNIENKYCTEKIWQATASKK